MKKIPSDHLLIGAHTSTAGGVHNAILKGIEIGATTIQLFTSNQKQWKGREFSQQDLDMWFLERENSNISHIMSHDSYLINLGSNKPSLLEKSQRAFEEEIQRCCQLKLSYMNFHPGAATGASEEECLNRIVNSLLLMEPLFHNQSLRLLLETTAGQGSTVGNSFEQLNYIISRVKNTIPIGVCIDTCHIFTAGYDIRTQKGWETVIKTFEKTIGWKHLFAFHLNDSQHDIGSKKDRHANLGKGLIGIKCFEVMMTHPKLRSLPKYLETPNGETMWPHEIQQLHAFASKSKEN